MSAATATFGEWLPEHRLDLTDTGLLGRHLYAISEDVPAEVRSLSDLTVFLADLGVADEIRGLARAAWVDYERSRSPRPPEPRSAPAPVRAEDGDVVEASPEQEREAARIFRKLGARGTR